MHPHMPCCTAGSGSKVIKSWLGSNAEPSGTTTPVIIKLISLIIIRHILRVCLRPELNRTAIHICNVMPRICRSALVRHDTHELVQSRPACALVALAVLGVALAWGTLRLGALLLFRVVGGA